MVRITTARLLVSRFENIDRRYHIIHHLIDTPWERCTYDPCEADRAIIEEARSQMGKEKAR